MPPKNAVEKPEPAELRILRRRQVEDRVGLSCSTIYSLIARKKFPAGFRLSDGQAVGWLESDISRWISDRIAASRGLDAIVNKAEATAAAFGASADKIAALESALAKTSALVKYPPLTHITPKSRKKS